MATKRTIVRFALHHVRHAVAKAEQTTEPLEGGVPCGASLRRLIERYLEHCLSDAGEALISQGVRWTAWPPKVVDTRLDGDEVEVTVEVETP